MSAGEGTSPQGCPPALTRAQTKALLAATVAAAQDTQLQRARRADAALLADYEDQARVGAALRRAREAAAVGWTKARDPAWLDDAFERVALAWASALAWETLDARAAVTARRLDTRLRAAGVHPEIARPARDSDDYAALSLLLALADQAAQQPVRPTVAVREPDAAWPQPEGPSTADIMAQATRVAAEAYLVGRGGPLGAVVLVQQVARLTDTLDQTHHCHYPW